VGLGELGVVPYTARHTGASLDRLEDNLSLAEVQRRGRWKAEASVRRYEKRTMAQEVAHMLSAHTRAYCMRASGQLRARLEGLWKAGFAGAPRGGGTGSSSSSSFRALGASASA